MNEPKLESKSNETKTPNEGQTYFGKFCLLMWKNTILRKRHWLLSLLEIAIPTGLMCLILFLRTVPGSKLLPTEVTTNTVFGVGTEMHLRKLLCERSGGNWKFPDTCNYLFNSNNSEIGDRILFWGPPTPFTKKIINIIQKEIFFEDENLQNVSSIKEMDDYVDASYIKASNSISAFYIGIFFNLEDLETDEPPLQFDYDLRLQKFWFTGYIYPFLEVPGPRNFSENVSSDVASYNVDGFTIIQTIIDRAFMQLLDGTDDNLETYKLETQMYPYPPYIQDHGMSQFYGAALPTFAVLSFILLSPTLIKSIVHEKETGVRELLRMMGLEGWMIWSGWFMYSFLPIFLDCVIMSGLLKITMMTKDDPAILIPPILTYSNGFLVFLFLILYGISGICFCFAVSCFFSKPTLATTIGVMLWLLTYFIPRAATEPIYDEMGLAAKLSLCLIPNMAITYTFKVIGMFEGRAVGVQWNNLWDTGNPRDQLAPAMILIMFSVEIILFILITWYVDQVMPGVYGVSKSWYFPFQKSYWKRKTPNNAGEDGEDFEHQRNPNFESEPAGMTPGIKIRGLRKEFKTLNRVVKVAVEHVDLTCFKGHCTVLLGHNGAGKTTTMSMLTGIYAPSNGYAELGGWNIKTSLKEARSQLGLCPQQNTLFSELSVEEHLLFFARLKGLNRKEAKRETKIFLHKLLLSDKKNRYGGELSGGMKRKLCLAIALIGGSKIVILDEPSSGLDPESRRWVWEIVQEERANRTVLLSTHHMEEAEVLGDRIAIMANGRVFCCGSLLYLKNKFGNGYSLSVEGKEDIDIYNLESIIAQYITNSKLESIDENFYEFSLFSETEKFPELLNHLASEKETLRINHIGVTLTTLEQVFFRVEKCLEEEAKYLKETTLQTGVLNKSFELEVTRLNEAVNENIADFEAVNENVADIEERREIEAWDLEANRKKKFDDKLHRDLSKKVDGYELMSQRFKSLMKKKILVTKRKWLLFIIQSLIPVAISILCIVVNSQLNEDEFKEPSRNLDLDMFEWTNSSLECHDLRLISLAHSYYEQFESLTHEVSPTDNVTETLLEAANENLHQYRENYVTSAWFRDDNGTIITRMYYQSIPYHTPGVGINLIDNAILQNKNASYKITTSNSPLPVNKAWQLDDQTTYTAVVYATVMPFALSFLTSSFLVFPLQERISKAKQIQLMTGTPTKLYWFTIFMGDFVSYSFSAVLVFICFMIFDTKQYFTRDQAPGALFLLLILYGFGSLPMAYVFSFSFSSAASGFAGLALVNMFAGVIISTVTITLDVLGTGNLVTISSIIGNISSFIPSYPLSQGFLGIVEVTNYNAVCDLVEPYLREELCETLHDFSRDSPYMKCCPYVDQIGRKYCEVYGTCFTNISYFQWEYPGIGQQLLFLAVDFILFFIILNCLEVGLANQAVIKMWETVRRIFPADVTEPSYAFIDQDVEKEKQIATELMHGENSDRIALAVHNLSKTFVKTGTKAVKNISFYVKKGECFGLLGVNGAGKTTTFRMLTGDEIRTSGDARIGSKFLSDGKNQFLEEIGYCPQFDATIDELTGEEMLSLMAGLRGISTRKDPLILKNIISLVGLTECAKRPTSTYSGGNKRKLSTAMALVGKPSLIFLDEPTSGVDPGSRRRVWEAVREVTKNGQSVILTSHSMDECEALCSKIIIMSTGIIRCVGTPKYLKAKYGKGYTLQIKIKSSLPKELLKTSIEWKENEEVEYLNLIEELKNQIAMLFPNCILTDEYRGMLVYKISSMTPLADVFSKMNELKAKEVSQHSSSLYRYLVENYAAFDPSLEQVFLSFAKEVSNKPRRIGIETKL